MGPVKDLAVDQAARTDESNEPLDISSMPKLDERDFQPLDSRYLLARLTLRGAAAAIVVLAGAVLLIVGQPLAAAVVVPVLAILGIETLLVTAAVRRMGFLVRERDLSLRGGLLSITEQTVPFNRVQHVQVDRGPLERVFGLASLSVNTAGGGLGRFRIRGLNMDLAEHLKAVVVERAALVDEE